MVIRDSHENSSSSVAPPALSYTASPIHRLLAQIVDIVIVLTPVFLVLSAPFKTRLYHGFLVENQEEIMLSILANIIIAFWLYVFYCTVGVWHWGTTVGKKLFHLRVVDIWNGSNLNFLRSFGRAILSAVSFCTLGLAFLPILSNHRRRPLSDLIFECEVISSMPTDVRLPNKREKWLVRGVFGFSALFVLLFATALVQSILYYSKGQEDLSAWFMDKTSKCEAIDQAMADWPKDDEKPSRLRVGLAMFAAGVVDRKCLQTETDGESIFSGAPSPLYYLAQSFVHSDESEVSDSYLKQVCKQDENSSSCELSQIIDAWSNNDTNALDTAFDHLSHPDIVSTVWAIRHFMKHGQPERAYSMIGKISPNKPLGLFLQVQRVKALWMMNRFAEAKFGALHGLESLPEEWQLELASWMCVQETSLKCKSSASSSCQWLSKQKDLDGDQEPQYAVAVLHDQECSDSGKLNYNELSSTNSSKSWRRLIRAVAKIRSGEQGQGLKILSDIIADSEDPDEFRAEALRRYMATASDRAITALISEPQVVPRNLWREVQPQLAMEVSRRHLSKNLGLAKMKDKGVNIRKPASAESEE